MFIIVKDLSSIEFDINGKTIILKGGCIANEISKDDFAFIKQNYAFFNDMLDKGFIIANETNAKKDIDKSVDDTLNNIKEKQSKAQNKNVKVNKL